MSVHRKRKAPRVSAAGRESAADRRADEAYSGYADPDCLRCHGHGWVSGHEPCPSCIVEVWG